MEEALFARIILVAAAGTPSLPCPLWEGTRGVHPLAAGEGTQDELLCMGSGDAGCHTGESSASQFWLFAGPQAVSRCKVLLGFSGHELPATREGLVLARPSASEVEKREGLEHEALSKSCEKLAVFSIELLAAQGGLLGN